MGAYLRAWTLVLPLAETVIATPLSEQCLGKCAAAWPGVLDVQNFCNGLTIFHGNSRNRAVVAREVLDWKHSDHFWRTFNLTISHSNASPGALQLVLNERDYGEHLALVRTDPGK